MVQQYVVDKEQDCLQQCKVQVEFVDQFVVGLQYVYVFYCDGSGYGSKYVQWGEVYYVVGNVEYQFGQFFQVMVDYVVYWVFYC